MHISESSAKIRHQSNTTALHTIAQQTTTSRMHLQTQWPAPKWMPLPESICKRNAVRNETECQRTWSVWRVWLPQNPLAKWNTQKPNAQHISESSAKVRHQSNTTALRAIAPLRYRIRGFRGEKGMVLMFLTKVSARWRLWLYMHKATRWIRLVRLSDLARRASIA